MTLSTLSRSVLRPPARLLRAGAARAALEREVRRGRPDADLAVFHDFAPPPAGGGHQFLRALIGEIESRGIRVEINGISATTRACLFNSFNFDPRRLRRVRSSRVRCVHRVDGPVEVYRGTSDGTDAAVAALNRELASATVFQSRYSLRAHQELGYAFASPVVVSNAVDPRIFWPAPGARALVPGAKARVIATSWSTNPNKGGAFYRWLDDHLDTDRYEVTFVGRTTEAFRRIRQIDAVDSHALADLLREHDIYLTASAHEACSNALIEALACGLPAAYLDSGSSPELVGAAGAAFTVPDELPAALDRVVREHAAMRAAIAVPSLAAVADAYLEVLGLAP